MSQLKRNQAQILKLIDIISNLAVYFKDIPNAKELNKYLFKEIKKKYGVKQILKERRKQTLVLVGIVKQIWIREKNTNLLLMNYLKWLTSVIKILVLQVN